MNTSPEPQDPWNRIRDVEHDPVTPEQMDEQLRQQSSGNAPLLLILFGTFIVATGITAAVLYYIGKALDLP